MKKTLIAILVMLLLGAVFANSRKRYNSVSSYLIFHYKMNEEPVSVDSYSPPSSGDGITYYVNTASTGSGDGTTQATSGANAAWAAISEITGLAAGDSVLFNRGNIWREQLNVPSSGSSGNLITFGAYGTGDKPIINGAEIITGNWVQNVSEWEDDSIDVEVFTVIVDGTLWTEGTAGSLSASEWDWTSANGGTLFIYGDPSGNSVEAGQRNYSILCENKDYIIIEDIILRNSNLSGLTFKGTSSNITVNDVESYGVGNDGFKQFDTTDVTYNNIIGSYNTDDGFSLHDSAIATINTGTFEYNVSGINNINNSQITIDTVVCTNNTSFGFWVLKVSGGVGGISTLLNSTFHDNDVNIKFEDDQRGTIKWCKSYDATDHAVDILDDTVVSIEYSLFYGALLDKFAVAVRAGATAEIKNCVFHDNAGGLFVEGIVTLYNTIFKDNTTRAVFFAGTGLSNFTLSNNCFHGNTLDFDGTGGGENTNGISTDPLFIDAANDNFRLLPSSLCIDAGIDVGLTRDFGRNPIWGIPDIGAHEIFVRDSSGNNHKGATYRDLADIHVTGKINGAFDFNGATDTVIISAHSDIAFNAGSWSLASWLNIRSDGGGNTGRIFHTDFHLFHVSNEAGGTVKVQCKIDADAGTDATTILDAGITLNVWHLVIFVFDGTDVTIYVDGKVPAQTQQSLVGTVRDSTGVDNIIGNQEAGNRGFDGLIDNVMLFNLELNAVQVGRIYNSGHGTENLDERDIRSRYK